MAVQQLDWRLSEAGLDEFEGWLAHAITESADMHEPLVDVRDQVQSMIFEEFISEGARSGGWEPLNPRYELWKIERGQFNPMELDAAFLHGNPGTPRDEKMYNVLLSDDSWNITEDDAIFEPDSSRAGWHQAGVPYRNKAGRLPSRPVLFFLETDYEDIERIFERWMEEDVIGEGGIQPFFGLGYKRYMGGFF